MVSLGTIGSLVGIGKEVFDAVEGRSAARQSERSARELAANERERRELEVKRHRRNVRRITGDAQAFFVGRGVSGKSGSALDIMADSMAEAALDEQIIEQGGEARENYALSQAENAARQGQSVFQGGLLSAGARVLRDFEELEKSFEDFFD